MGVPKYLYLIIQLVLINLKQLFLGFFQVLKPFNDFGNLPY